MLLQVHRRLPGEPRCYGANERRMMPSFGRAAGTSWVSQRLHALRWTARPGVRQGMSSDVERSWERQFDCVLPRARRAPMTPNDGSAAGDVRRGDVWWASFGERRAVVIVAARERASGRRCLSSRRPTSTSPHCRRGPHWGGRRSACRRRPPGGAASAVPHQLCVARDRQADRSARSSRPADTGEARRGRRARSRRRPRHRRR
jgi:hypothetical protein